MRWKLPGCRTVRSQALRAPPRRPAWASAAEARRASRAADSVRPATLPRRRAASVRREAREPRPNWRQRCEDAGFFFHSMGGTYWDETACYAFSAVEVDRIEEITAEMHQLGLKAADEAVRSKRFAQF